MKILFITNIPSPSRVDFFEELGLLSKLTVIYEKNHVDYREDSWLNFSANNYCSVYLSKNIFKKFMVLKKYLNDKSYDRIVINGYNSVINIFSIFILSFHNRKFILSCDGGILKEESKVLYNLKRSLINKANIVLSTGKETNKFLNYYDCTNDKIRIYPFTSLHNDDVLHRVLNSSDKEKLKKQLGVKNKKIILFVGSFIKRKGVDILLESACSIPKDISIFIIGGEPTEETRNFVDRNNLTNVHFFDFMSKDKLFDYYKIADLFVFPTREDIWGLVINEAMANGLPIITTNKCVAGIELINGNGMLINSDDPDSLTRKITEVICNEEKLYDMSNKSIEIIKDYTIEKMALRVYDILREDMC